MIIGIHQPQYLPWLGYFDKIDKSDIFVLLDDVQFKKNEWQNRNKIKTAEGWQWLTVPVLYRFPQKISEILINNKVNWRRKHFKALVNHYGRAKYFQRYKDFFQNTYAGDWNYLARLNIHIIKYLSKALGIETPLVQASKFKLAGRGTAHLVEICKRLGASCYLSGIGGRAYLDLRTFKKARIKVVFQDFRHPRYKQVYETTAGFQSNLSCVDLLFNHGEMSLAILSGGKRL